MNGSALFIVVLVVLAVLGLFIIPRLLLRRAINQVIRIFRQHNATDVKTAKTIDELGLSPPAFMQRMLQGRDYKPYALGALRRSEIIQMTEDGKLYLSEERLAYSGSYKH